MTGLRDWRSILVGLLITALITLFLSFLVGLDFPETERGVFQTNLVSEEPKVQGTSLLGRDASGTRGPSNNKPHKAIWSSQDSIPMGTLLYRAPSAQLRSCESCKEVVSIDSHYSEGSTPPRFIWLCPQHHKYAHRSPRIFDNFTLETL